MAHVDAFPWSELPTATSDEGGLARALRIARLDFDLGGLGELARDWLGAELQGAGVSSYKTREEVRLGPLSAFIATRQVGLAIRAEAELVCFALTRLLERPFRVNDLQASPRPALVGAWHALVLELGRRLCLGEPPRLDTPVRGSVGPATVLDAWLRLDRRSFKVELAIVPRELPEAPARGDVPVTLQLVAGTARLENDELAGLRAGDVLLPGASWFYPVDPTKQLVAVPAEEERGFRLQLSDVVSYVGPASLPHQGENQESTLEDATKESVIAETPVIMRVEVGSITLSAREWMALSPGDVLSCGVPPRGPVILRTAGREVARGELVTVDGQLGVRILALGLHAEHDTKPGPAPRPEES